MKRCLKRHARKNTVNCLWENDGTAGQDNIFVRTGSGSDWVLNYMQSTTLTYHCLMSGMFCMKYILFLQLLLVISSAMVIGQTTAARCPEISVEVVPEVPLLKGETMTFTAIVKAVQNVKFLKFHWLISSGKIIGGQGTNKIRVVSTQTGDGITATVEIKGMPDDCING